MPAKYSHRYTTEQLTNTGRNTWKRPDPPPKPKPKQYFVLGMEVDYNTYREYNYEKSWTIDGDVLKDIPCTLWSLEHWATDEHAKDYPIEAANARKILDQIRAEITSKGENTVKQKKTSCDFIDALAKIYTECRTAYESQQNKLGQARDWMEATQKEAHAINCPNRQVAELRYFTAKAEWQLAEDDTRKEVAAIQDDFSARVKELREQFGSYLDEHYSASPDKLDTATMQLLNSGICSPAELARLVDRHHGNPTMLRIVGEYTKNLLNDNRCRMSIENQLICSNVTNTCFSAKDGGREMNIFDSAASAAERGLQQDSIVAGKMHNHIVGWFDSFRAQMDDVPNAPAETAVGAEQRRQDRQAAAEEALDDALAKERKEREENSGNVTYIQE